MSRVPIRTIVETWKACSRNYSEAARRLGIDRPFRWKGWVDRGRQPWGYPSQEGRQGVQRQSTAPRHPRRALFYQATAQVRAWRQATGFCREKLAYLAQVAGITVPASTIHRMLQRAGLIRASPSGEGPAPSAAGPALRTARSCAPVTAPAWAISRWT